MKHMPKIDFIEIERSAVVGGSHNLRIECGGYTYVGNFDNNIMHFMQACAEAIKYFGAAHGLTVTDKEGTTRRVDS